MKPNSYKVIYDGGVLTVDDAARVAAEGVRRQEVLSLADVRGYDSARKAAVAQLAAIAAADPIVADVVLEEGSRPHLDYLLFDRFPVTQYDGTGTDNVKVAGMTVAEGTGEDDLAVVTAVLELRSAVEDAAELDLARTRRAALGADSDVVSMRRDDNTTRSSGPIPYEVLTWAEKEPEEGELGGLNFERSSVPVSLDVTLLTPGTTATVLELKKNGALMSCYQNNVGPNTQVLIPAGVYHVICLFWDQLPVSKLENFVLEITQLGGGAANLKAELLGASVE